MKKKYFIKDGYNDEICRPHYKVYKRVFFGLLPPKFVDWYLWRSDAEKAIERLSKNH